MKKKEEDGLLRGHGLGRKEFAVEVMTPPHRREHEHTERLEMSSQQRTAGWSQVSPLRAPSSLAEHCT